MVWPTRDGVPPRDVRPHGQEATMPAARLALATASLLSLLACTERSPLAPLAAADAARPSLGLQASSDATPAAGPWARVLEGETGPGSLHAIYVPRDWNGDAVVYAHGFRDAWSPVDLRDQDGLFAMRDQLGALGFAVAYSSYSTNGFAVKDGAERTHQLRGLLASALQRQPARTFLAGHSLGAAVALSLAERYPEQYAGALLLCGMVGGSRVQTDYLGHTRALFDHYFPGRLPGDALSYPAGQVVTLPQVVAAVQSNPMGLFAIASTAQTPLPYVPVGNVMDPSSAAFQTMVGSLFGALNFHSRGIANILELTHGMSPFGNTDTRYVLGAPVLPAPLVPALQTLIGESNGGVARYTMAQSAENYLEHSFTPSGDLRIPVLTVHNTWDPGVPAFHEQALLEKASAAGATGMLKQRSLPTYGHCNIPTAYAVQSLTDLVSWATTGVKPAN
jgi:pimeloyl-ACP methyl ester carboxylesterase